MTRADLDKHHQQVADMFDGVAPRYDLVNDVLSLGQDRLWRRATTAAVDPQPGQRVLDLAAGTGTSSQAFARCGASVVAVDLSLGMLATGKARHPDLPFVNADALELPFADASFDAVTISFGLRNIDDTDAALRELLRVAKPGGRIVICEFSKPTSHAFRKLYDGYLAMALPRLAGLASSNPAAYDYLAESILAWPDQLGLADAMCAAGWRQIGWKNLSGGIVALHRAWRP
ncbi:MAG: demethylmenaquinone methyltransferase [Propionibacteriaceae bacterium]|nr:demethylmenaquinone methyltransferase [Propionibacteriaceae bacterium]